MSRKFTFFVHMNATRDWLALTRKERGEYYTWLQAEVFDHYPDVHVRLFDVEAFSARCSDIAMYETENIQQYYFLMEALRDSKVYTVPYFEVVDIFPAIEDGFTEYENNAATP